MNNDIFWVDIYRPRKVSECILPESLKKTFQAYVDKGQVPNMILAGGPGMGKTTVAIAMCEELGLDYIMINGSKENNIDTLRTKIVGYASSVSLMGGRKVIIVDEADYLNPNSTQPAFRGVIEEFSGNCSFIFTCNYKNKLIEPLHSRFTEVDFRIPKEEKPKLAQEFCKRIEEILKSNNVKFEKKTLVHLILEYFPDFRKIINELQRYSVSGTIDDGIFTNLESAKIDEVLKFIKDKSFKDLRTWVGQNLDNDTVKIMHEVYLRLNEVIKPEYIPAAVVLLGKYSYQAAFCADAEINLMAFFSELMLECEVKS